MADRPDTDALRRSLDYLARKNPTSTWDLASRVAFVTRADEALVEADRLAARLSEAEREKEWWTAVNAELLPYQERAVKAEARLSEYEQALQRIAEGAESNPAHEVAALARAALSGSAGSGP